MATPTHCPQGHSYNEANTYWQVRPSGNKTACCRACQRKRHAGKKEYFRDHMRRWRSANKERNNRNWRNCRLVKKQWLEVYKAQGCSRCPEKDPVCIDFHHRDPSQKELEVSLAIARWSLERIRAEVAKCDLLCSNCHRKLHASESQEKVA